MDELYNNSFVSIKSLYQKSREQGLNVTVREVREFLKGKRSYTLHRDARKKFKRNKIRVVAIDEMWSCDLAVAKHPVVNRGFKWLLVIVDALSRKLRVVPMKNKTGPTTAEAFRSILSQGSVPYSIRTDLGTEFFNSHVKALFKEYDILHYKALNRTKASLSERAIRSLKSRLYRYMTEKNSKRFIDILPRIVADMNKTPNRSIKMAPNDVTVENQADIAADPIIVPTKNIRFAVGDVVRISLKVNPKAFDRGFEKTWSDEIFTVTRIHPYSEVATYTLSDQMGNTLTGRYYPEEINRINIPQT